MTTVADIRTELALIATYCDGDWRGSAYVGDQINGPTCKVSAAAFDPRFVFGGAKRRQTFRCTFYTPRVDTMRAEEALDLLADPTGTASFIAQVQDGDNWSITVDSAQVVLVGEVAATQFGTDVAEYLARSFDVEVVW